MDLFHKVQDLSHRQLKELAGLCAGMALLAAIALTLSGSVPFAPSWLKLAISNINQTAATANAAAVPYWATQGAGPSLQQQTNPWTSSIGYFPFPSPVDCYRDYNAGGYPNCELQMLSGILSGLSVGTSNGRFATGQSQIGGYAPCYPSTGQWYPQRFLSAATTTLYAFPSSQVQLDWACQPQIHERHALACSDGMTDAWQIPMYTSGYVTSSLGQTFPSATWNGTVTQSAAYIGPDTVNTQNLIGSTTITTSPTVGTIVDYRLYCSVGGVNTLQATVRVQVTSAQLSLTANPSTIGAGQSSTLTWNTYNTSQCTITGPNGVVGGTGLGTDGSGNNNVWTPNNITALDQTIDTPTNNFATLNQIYYYSPQYGKGTVQGGGLAANGGYGTAAGWQLSSGKWYWESTPQTGSVTGGYPIIGVWADPSSGIAYRAYPGQIYEGGVGYGSDGKTYRANLTNITPTLSTFTAGDVIGTAYDADTGKVYFSKNGVWQNSGNPAAGTGYVSLVKNGWAGLASYYGKTLINFGQLNMPITTTYSTPGSFSYSVPAGATSIKVTVNGAGGGGGGSYNADWGSAGTNGGTGGNTTFNASVVGSGGTGGAGQTGSNVNWPAGYMIGATLYGPANGTGGAASGGDTNTAGGAANGGAGGAQPGWGTYAGTGGGGGRAIKTYAAGQLSGSIPLVVGSGGAAGINPNGSDSNGSTNGSVGSAGSVTVQAFFGAVGGGASGGNYYYTPPTGFKALSSATLPAVAVAQPKQYFDASIWNGGTAPSTVPLNFAPDLVWAKQRNGTGPNWINDTLRGARNALFPSMTNAQGSTGLDAFLSNGYQFTVAAGNENGAGGTYVGWAWKESPTAGIDIVQYTGNGAPTQAISNSLGTAPDFAIIKRIDAASDWQVWSSALSAAGSPFTYLKLNTIDKNSGFTANWNMANTVPPAGTDAIPQMTAQTTSGVTMTGSTEYSTGYAWKAGDKQGNASYWDSYPNAASVAAPQWIRTDFGASVQQTIGAYSIQTYYASNNYQPSDFTLQGSNDAATCSAGVGVAGSVWTVLDTEYGVYWYTNHNTETFYVPAANQAPYRCYRIAITRTQDGNRPIVAEINLWLASSLPTASQFLVSNQNGTAPFNAPVLGADAMPTMTGATTAGVTITTSSVVNASWPGWYVGDKTNNYWQAAAPTPSVAAPQWLNADFGASTKTIAGYSIQIYANANNYQPTDFTFQGSNDAATCTNTGSGWTTLATETGAYWTAANETKTFYVPFASQSAYRCYRLYVTRTSDANVLIIKELNLWQASPTAVTITGPTGTATGSGATPVSGRIGQALQFSAGSSVTAPSSAVLDTDTHTISFWIKFNGTSAVWTKIFQYAPAGTDRSPGIWQVPGNYCLHWRYAPSNSGAACAGPTGESTQFTPGVWYLVTGIKNGGTLTMYVNGVQTQTSAVDNPKTAGSASVILGQAGATASVTLDDVRIYNRALSATDVGTLFSGSGSGDVTTGRTLYWTFDTANTSASGASQYIAYLFSNREGFQKSGVYTANGSADGPFLYTGFEPKFVMVKGIGVNTNAGTNWNIYDSVRDTGSPLFKGLDANLSTAESGDGYCNTSSCPVDFLANGFKVRNGSWTWNANNSNMYQYVAFADVPFKSSTTAYNLTIPYSLRFDGSSNAYLTRTPVVTGNLQKETLSFWVKRGQIGTSQMLLTTPNRYEMVAFSWNCSWDALDINIPYYSHLCSTPLLRDPSHWYHIVIAVDTTQPTASDRVKLYIDGVQAAFSSGTQPPLNTIMTEWNVGNKLQAIGHDIYNNGNAFDGNLADFYMIDGQQLTPAYFGQYDTNGFWKPKSYAGTYGANGFHLDFSTLTTTDFTIANGSVPVGPLQQTTTYTLSCYVPEGVILSTTATVTVGQGSFGTASLTACNSSNSSCSTSVSVPALAALSSAPNLSWTTAGINAGSCSVVQKDPSNAYSTISAMGAVNGDINPSKVGPALAQGSNTFTLSCVSPVTTGNNVTLINSPISGFAGKFGEAVAFNGTSQYLTTPAAAGSSLDIDASPVTISAWIKTNAINPAQLQSIVSRGYMGAQGYGLFVNTNGNINVGRSGGGNFDSTVPITAGSWYHVVGVINGASSKVYINGVDDTPTTVSVAVVASDLPLNIGLARDSGNNQIYYFNGSIDDVRIYNRALSASEVLTLNDGGQITSGMVGYWPLDSVSIPASTAYDLATGVTTSSAAITVSGPPSATISASTPVTVGGSSTLNWSSSNVNAGSCSVVQINASSVVSTASSIGAGDSGNQSGPALTGAGSPYTYKLACYSPVTIGNNATLVGTPTTGATGKFGGQAITFNGTSQYLTNASPTGLPTGSVMSASAWVYPTGYPDATYNGIVRWGPAACNSAFLMSVNNAGKLTFANWCNDRAQIAGTGLTLNAWNHVVETLNGQTVKFYVNGTLQDTQALGGVPAVIAGPVSIGSTDAPGRYFQGSIDDVRIYNRELSASEVSTLNTGGHITSGLVGYWPFDTSTGSVNSTTAYDLTGGLVTQTSNSVTVSSVSSPPSASTMTLTATRVQRGSPSTLTWSVQGMDESLSCTIDPAPPAVPAWTADNCTLSGNISAWCGSAQTGNISVPTRYTLSCGNGVASSSVSAVVPLVPTVKEI